MSDVDLPDRLDRYGGVARIERVAVMPNHIIEHRLPTFSADAKTKDARHAWFVDQHGGECCELDALNPNTLRYLVEAAILDSIDADAWDRADVAEAAEEASLRDFFLSWPGVA